MPKTTPPTPKPTTAKPHHGATHKDSHDSLPVVARNVTDGPATDTKPPADREGSAPAQPAAAA